VGRGRKCAAILSYQINLGNILTNAAASSFFSIEVKFPILLHGLLYGDDSAIAVETKKAVEAFPRVYSTCRTFVRVFLIDTNHTQLHSLGPVWEITPLLFRHTKGLNKSIVVVITATYVRYELDWDQSGLCNK